MNLRLVKPNPWVKVKWSLYLSLSLWKGNTFCQSVPPCSFVIFSACSALRIRAESSPKFPQIQPHPLRESLLFLPFTKNQKKKRNFFNKLVPLIQVCSTFFSKIFLFLPISLCFIVKFSSFVFIFLFSLLKIVPFSLLVHILCFYLIVFFWFGLKKRSGFDRAACGGCRLSPTILAASGSAFVSVLSCMISTCDSPPKKLWFICL